MKFGVYKDGMPWASLKSMNMDDAIKEVLHQFAHKKLELIDRPHSNVARFRAASTNEYVIFGESAL